MQTILYVVGYCPSCDTGPLGVRVCGGCGTAWVQCDECDAVFADPKAEPPARFLEQPEMPCPQCGTSLWEPPSHWASYDEMEQFGWLDQIIAQGSPLANPSSSWADDERPWNDPIVRSDGPQDPNAASEADNEASGADGI